MNDWFTIDRIDEDTYMISEYCHWEETHCYLLNGTKSSLLIDTGLGIADISGLIDKLTDKPVIAGATHVHWDHIGGHRSFSDIYVYREEVNWLDGGFPLPLQAVKSMAADRCDLPEGYDISVYQIFQGKPARILADGDEIEIGGRRIQVIHTPGHSPGHMCFWEPDRGYLFAGDLAYIGTLYANYPSTDPAAYLDSLKKMAALPVRRLFPGHHTLDIQPEILVRMQNAFCELEAGGKLCHGSGTFDYGDWSVSL